jgi:hypothetical protein
MQQQNMPPMPQQQHLQHQLNQQNQQFNQYQQTPQYAQFQTSGYPSQVINTTLTAPVPGEVTNRPVVDNFNKILKSKNNSIDHILHKRLNVDFKLVETMNLLDDDSLETLYLASPGFTDNKYFFSTLVQLYRSKYTDLYERNPNLDGCVSFWVATIIYESESVLHSLCSQRNSSFIPCGENPALLSMKRLRRSEAVPAAAVKPIDVKKVSMQELMRAKNHEQKEIIKLHPFLKSGLYKQYQTLFHIGRCTKYCISSDFATLNATIVTGLVNKYSNQTKLQYDGFHVNFDKPIISFVSHRMGKDFSYFNVCGFNELSNLIKRMTTLEASQEAFSFGTKRKMNMRTIDI